MKMAHIVRWKVLMAFGNPERIGWTGQVQMKSRSTLYSAYSVNFNIPVAVIFVLSKQFYSFIQKDNDFVHSQNQIQFSFKNGDKITVIFA